MHLYNLMAESFIAASFSVNNCIISTSEDWPNRLSRTSAAIFIFDGMDRVNFWEITGYTTAVENLKKKNTTVISVPRIRYFSQKTLTNRTYLFNSAEYLTASKTVACK